MRKKPVNHTTINFHRKLPVISRPYVVGITGGIACGKSLISHLFECLGAARINADDLAREAVAPGSTAWTQIVSHFGKDILAASGAIDRAELAKRIFADPHERQVLNRITHPVIGALATSRIRELAATPTVPLIIYEAPLLFEAQAEGRVDLVLVVASTAENQLARLMRRDGLSRDDAQLRIAAQMPLAEKIARADIVIDNNATPEEATLVVDRIFAELTEHMKKNPPEPGDFENSL